MRALNTYSTIHSATTDPHKHSPAHPTKATLQHHQAWSHPPSISPGQARAQVSHSVILPFFLSFFFKRLTFHSKVPQVPSSRSLPQASSSPIPDSHFTLSDPYPPARESLTTARHTRRLPRYNTECTHDLRSVHFARSVVLSLDLWFGHSICASARSVLSSLDLNFRSICTSCARAAIVRRGGRRVG